MCQCLKRIQERLEPLKIFSEDKLLPVLYLIMRLMVGYDFIKSGWLKFGYVLNHQLDALYFLFDDYKVPLLPSHVAAWLGMGGELGFGIMLLLGIFARLGGLGLMFMCAVIYHTDHNQLAPYWAIVCALVVLHGPGKWSLDQLIWKKKKETL